MFESKGFLEYIITDNCEEAEDFVSSDTEIILLDEDEIIKLYEQEYSRATYLNFNRYENLSEKFINRKKKEKKMPRLTQKEKLYCFYMGIIEEKNKKGNYYMRIVGEMKKLRTECL